MPTERLNDEQTLLHFGALIICAHRLINDEPIKIGRDLQEALKEAHDQGLIPAEIAAGLYFPQTDAGYMCIQLEPAIKRNCYPYNEIAEINFATQEVDIDQIDEWLLERLLKRIAVDTETARTLGDFLRQRAVEVL